MKKRYIIWIGVLCLVLVLGIVFGPKLYRAVRVYGMLEDFLTEEAASMDVTLSMEAEKKMDLRLDWQDVGGKRLYTLESGGVEIFYRDGVVYLENGKAYDFSGAVPDVSELLEKPWALYPLVQISQKDGTWTVVVDTARILPELWGVTLVVEEGDEGARTLQCFGWQDKNGGYLGVQALRRQDRQVLEVPQAVRDAIESGAVQSGKDLTEDMLGLLKGWAELTSRETLGMELNLSADCGPIALADTLTLRRDSATGISYVEKDGYGLYFSGDKICTAGGTVLASSDSSVEAAALLGLAYQLCLNGDLTCDEGVYSLTLDQAGMEQVAYAIAPEAESLNVAFQSGSLEIRMEEDTIQSIRLSVSGSVDLLLAQVEGAIGAELVPVENVSFEIPQEVLDALGE